MDGTQGTGPKCDSPNVPWEDLFEPEGHTKVVWKDDLWYCDDCRWGY